MKKDRYNIAVLGAGSWGITLANVLYENGNTVILWEFDRKQAANLTRERKFLTLGSYRIPAGITVTDSMRRAVEAADYIVISVPSSVVGSVIGELSRQKLRPGVTVVSSVKGFDQKTLKRPSQIIKGMLGRKANVAVISGPSHAEEVIKRVPTAVVAASVDNKTRTHVQKLFSNLYFRVYSSSDINGVELGGALKNIIGIASGIVSGLKLGDNTRAALITRGNAEITRLGARLGARSGTFSGLSGIGDLIVTCFSHHSRNFRFGKLIGEGSSMDEALRKIKTTVEGINTTRSCYRLSRKLGVQMPVCGKVYEILYRKKEPEKAWRELMSRPLKSEKTFRDYRD